MSRSFGEWSIPVTLFVSGELIYRVKENYGQGANLPQQSVPGEESREGKTNVPGKGVSREGSLPEKEVSLVPGKEVSRQGSFPGKEFRWFPGKKSPGKRNSSVPVKLVPGKEVSRQGSFPGKGVSRERRRKCPGKAKASKLVPGRKSSGKIVSRGGVSGEGGEGVPAMKTRCPG